MERKDIKDEQAAKHQLHYFRRNDIPELTEAELEEESNLIYKSLIAGKQAKSSIKKLWIPAIAAAAVVIIIAGAYLFTRIPENTTDKSSPILTAQVNDIVPGKNSATLTLANGKKIVLSDATNGEIAVQAGVSISKNADGKLVYTAKDLKTNTIEFNTLSTVKGQQYQVILPDGSEIWLNAASSITYPANFANLKNRKVQLSGEAYFEVAKDKKHPFIVKTDKQQVEVLGTHFNINSYQDEKATKTTLLEGSVRVSDDKEQKVLLPGQQSMLTQNKLSVSKVDIDRVVAWKNGDFIFNNEEFGSILRQISRWYNVEIINDKNHEGLHISGTISRSKNIFTVLKALEVTGEVKFKIEGKKVIVTE